jgi:hypothetical protein
MPSPTKRRKKTPSAVALGALRVASIEAPKPSGRGVGGWGAAQPRAVVFKGRFACNNYGIVLRLESTRGEH